GAALHPPRLATSVPGTAVLAGLPARRARLPVPVPAVVHGALADLCVVDPAGPGDLLRLRLSPQPAQPRRGRRYRLTAAGRRRRPAPRRRIDPASARHEFS